MTDSSSQKWSILAAVTLVSFITNVDATIVIIGLPRLMSGLHITVVTGLWTITSYIITSTVFLLPAGRWSDIIGTKRIFLAGLAIFTVSTALCGFANSGATLIIYRFIQGTGAAFALATATPIIVRAFPQKELGRALGINSTSWVIGSIVGPVVGGALINAYGWRSIFFVTVPFAIIGMIAAAIVLRNTTERVQAKTDWLGIITFGIGLITLLLALSEGQSWGWTSGQILGLFVATVVLLVAFVIIEFHTSAPLFNLKLLTNGHYSAGLGITISYSIGYFATTFLLTLYLQGALHLNPLDAGLLLIPLSAPQLLMGPVGGALADRFGAVRLILSGVTFLAIGTLLLGWLGAELSIAAIVIPQIVMSAANGLAWPSLSKVVLSAAPREQTGSASGMFYTFRNVGMSLSLTLALVVAELSVPKAVASQAFLGTAGVLSAGVKAALVHSTDAGFRFFVVFYVISLILALFMIRKRKESAVAG